jgi:hypothetical protein
MDWSMARTPCFDPLWVPLQRCAYCCRVISCAYCCAGAAGAYSNSFVNLAIFKPDVERSRVADLIGPEAEQLTYRFCVVSSSRCLFCRVWGAAEWQSS